jgi:glycogen(starch) synthase
MNTASIVVMPSRTEGLPQVSLQAAQMARPVVAACVGGLAEIVVDGETGLLVPPEDSDALASAIAQLLAHPEDAGRMGVAARCRVQERFDWKSYLDGYQALYSRIYAGGRDVERQLLEPE